LPSASLERTPSQRDAAARPAALLRVRDDVALEPPPPPLRLLGVARGNDPSRGQVEERRRHCVPGDARVIHEQIDDCGRLVADVERGRPNGWLARAPRETDECNRREPGRREHDGHCRAEEFKAG
jgi:hypothetical protein